MRELEDGPLQEMKDLMIETINGSLRGRLDLFSIYSEMKDGNPQIDGISFRILIGTNPTYNIRD